MAAAPFLLFLRLLELCFGLSARLRIISQYLLLLAKSLPVIRLVHF
jgi:hypothetical protein